jgi:hypothetical protein
MKKNAYLVVAKFVFMAIILLLSENGIAQYQTHSQSKSPFWQNVQFGGGLGVSIGSGFTDISIAPSAMYNINPYLSMGLGLQGSYVSSKGFYNSAIYGASILTYINPIPQIQFSINLNESRVNNSYTLQGGTNYSKDFWNTALFLGAGYRTGNVTIGLAYNVLYNEKDNVYGDALMPFVRAYF